MTTTPLSTDTWYEAQQRWIDDGVPSEWGSGLSKYQPEELDKALAWLAQCRARQAARQAEWSSGNTMEFRVIRVTVVREVVE